MSWQTKNKETKVVGVMRAQRKVVSVKSAAKATKVAKEIRVSRAKVATKPRGNQRTKAMKTVRKNPTVKTLPPINNLVGN
jgi:hypothetical protein